MTEIVRADVGALAYLGNPEHRQTLMEIMAEQLGIPSRDANRPDVVALIANAVERNREYGWKPGVHMHVQAFNTKDKETGEPYKKYSLVDGEKAWKDSGARWRTEYGIIWRYQRKPMTKAQIEEEARSMGCDKPLSANMFGIWCRVMIMGEDDFPDPDNPMWSSGAWFGWVKAGLYWREDQLPTGNTPRDVAVRRADKRAMMQSTLSLLPVDSRSPEERSRQLVADLAREENQRQQWTSVASTSQAQRYIVEDDGDVLWAADPTPPTKALESTVEDEVDFYESDGLESTIPEAESIFANLSRNLDYSLSDAAYEVIKIMAELQATSSRKMSADGLNRLVELLRADKIEFDNYTPFFEALTAHDLEDGIPGVKVGKPFVGMLANGAQKAAIKNIADAVMMVLGELEN